ncbi:hypothetical protein [Micromonospora sp. NPDC051006]|uniref:hypothetical protein n=1 Tax=Micromonospora sp. NPDC051006 TaxID=3364283 RepID=UPI003788C444
MVERYQGEPLPPAHPVPGGRPPLPDGLGIPQPPAPLPPSALRRALLLAALVVAVVLAVVVIGLTR